MFGWLASFPQPPHTNGCDMNLRLVLARIVGITHIAFVVFILTRATPSSALILSGVNTAPATALAVGGRATGARAVAQQPSWSACHEADECEWLVISSSEASTQQ